MDIKPFTEFTKCLISRSNHLFIYILRMKFIERRFKRIPHWHSLVAISVKKRHGKIFGNAQLFTQHFFDDRSAKLILPSHTMRRVLLQNY